MNSALITYLVYTANIESEILIGLIRAGKNINVMNTNGETAIIVISKNPIETFNSIKLVEEGADVTHTDWHNWNALILYSKYNVCPEGVTGGYLI